MKETIVVTGGGGFIGHHLVNDLVKENNVVVLDNFTRGVPERLNDNNHNLTIKNCDITDYQMIEKCLKNLNVKVIYHLAAINGTGNFYKIPLEIMDVGILGCYNILKFSKENGIKKIITASSAEVYQESKTVPTPENVPLVVPDIINPRFSYGLSKIYTEYYSYHFGLKFNLNMSIFRPHNVFGPDMGLQHVIPQFIMEFLRQANGNNKITIQAKGSLEAIRAFCYIDDIVKGLLLLSKKNIGVNVYNIGNTERVTMNDLLSEIGKKLKLPFSISQSTDEHVGGSMLRCPDIQKIEKLGFSCETSLSDGLSKTIDWYQDNYENLKLIKNVQY